MIRVVLVDDHPLFRKGLEHVMADQPDVEIVAQFPDIATTQAWLQGGGQADVVLLDRGLPDGDGLDLVPAFKAHGMRVVMLTIADEDYAIREAIEHGVDGYVLKSADPARILEAVRAVQQGSSQLPAEAVQKIARGEVAPGVFAPLSPRELEIVTYVARGMSNRAIGEALALSENTVRNHLRSILDKLGLKNRVQVATLALESGLVRRRRPNPPPE